MDEILQKLFGIGSVAGGGLLTKSAYDRLQSIGEQAVLGKTIDGQRIPGSIELAQEALDMSQFRPFTVTTATGGGFGVTGPQVLGPDEVRTSQFIDANQNGIDDRDETRVGLTLSPAEQQLQQSLMSQAQQGLGGVVGAPSSQTAGLQLMGRGRTLYEQDPFGLGQQQAAAQQAFGLGGQFMGASAQQPADINLLRGQFAGQVGGLLGQQPSPAIGQFGQQALGMGQAGLGAMAPADVEALRQQYGGLAGQAAQDVLMPTAQREADVFERIRATQRPEEERQRLQLEERLAQQGRLGVRTAMFGGTPEQMALSRAQEEAQDRASLMAMQQAQAERQQALGAAQTLGGMFGQQAGLSSQLQSQAQQRAAQLSQLGLSAQQIESQLQSEGLSRAATAAGQAGQMAQLAGGLQAQQAGLGATYAGLGSQLAAQQQALGAAQQEQALQSLAAGQGLLSGGLGLQQAQQQLALGALAGAYVPQAQLLNVQQATQLYPQLQQQAQLFGAGQYGETMMSGLEARLIAEQARANLLGGLGTGLFGGMFSPVGSKDDGYVIPIIEMLGG
jgi:hypothetical protein